MYEYQLARHLAYERRLDIQRFVEQERLIARAEKTRPPKNSNLHFSRIGHLLRRLLSSSLGIERPAGRLGSGKVRPVP